MAERIPFSGSFEVNTRLPEVTKVLGRVYNIRDIAEARIGVTVDLKPSIENSLVFAKAEAIAMLVMYLSGRTSSEELLDFIDPKGVQRQAQVETRVSISNQATTNKEGLNPGGVLPTGHPR